MHVFKITSFIGVIAVCAGLAAPSAADPFRVDPERSGRSPFDLVRRRPRIRARISARLAIHSSPAVASDGSVVFASVDGTVTRASRQGRVLWRRRLGSAIFASPAIAGDRVLVGSDADRMFCLALASGRTLWSFALGPCPEAKSAGRGPESVRCDADSSPVVVGDRVIFGGDALYCVDLRRGTLRWRLPLPTHAFSSPAVGADGTIYIGTQSPQLRRVTPTPSVPAAPSTGATPRSAPQAIHAVTADGRLRWVFRAGWDCDATPALSAEAVHVGCDDQLIYSLARADGRLRWKLRTGGAVRSSPAVARDGTVVVGSYDHRLYAVHPDGKLAWTFSTGGPIHSSPAMDRSGNLVVGSRDDHLYALDAAGKLLWRLQLGGDVDSSPTIGPGGLLYVGADDGFLYVLGQ